MSDDQIVRIVAVALLAVQLGVLAWTLWTRADARLLVLLNLVTSAVVVAWWAPHFTDIGNYVAAVWVFVALEIAVFATSLLATFHMRVPAWLIWTEFSVQTLLVAALVLFIFTFRITRLM